MDGFETIYQAYLKGAGKWKGCDWPTQVGTIQISPEGLTSSQAFLAARTTSAAEAAEWETLALWLAQIERDAEAAEEKAKKALEMALSGRLLEALMNIQQACAIEARYPHKPVWQSMLTAVTMALIEEGQRERNQEKTLPLSLPKITGQTGVF